MKKLLQTEKIERKVLANVLTRALFSQTCLAFIYGLYLCMYDVKFLDDLIAPFHVLLIGWTAVLTVYNVLVRKIWKKITAWQWLLLFFVSAGLTTILNRETGLASNIKSWVLSVLPICAFFPACFDEEPEKRKKVFFSVLLGGAAVVFAASALSVFTYLIRFDKTITLFGITESVGIRWLTEGGVKSVLLYGVYLDPNYAAACSLFYTVYSAALFFACRKNLFAKQWKNRLGKGFAVANFIVQVCYFPLANSRGAWLSLLFAGFVAGFMYLYCAVLKMSSKTRRAIAAAVMAAAFVAVSYVGLLGLRNTLSYLSVHISQIEIKTGGGSNATGAEGKGEEVAEEETHVDSFVKQDDGTGSGRLEIWKEALTLFAHKPLFGTAPRNNQYYALKYGIDSVRIANGAGVHNSYLDVLVEYGIVGTLLLFGFFIACMVDVLKNVFVKGVKEISYYFVIFGALVMCCTSAFLSAAFINTTAMYFLLLVPIGYLITMKKSENGGAEQ